MELLNAVFWVMLIFSCSTHLPLLKAIFILSGGRRILYLCIIYYLFIFSGGRRILYLFIIIYLFITYYLFIYLISQVAGGYFIYLLFIIYLFIYFLRWEEDTLHRLQVPRAPRYDQASLL